jgi:chromosome segregation ATPase
MGRASLSMLSMPGGEGDGVMSVNAAVAVLEEFIRYKRSIGADERATKASAALARLAARIEEVREGERNWQKLYYESRDRAEAAEARIKELENYEKAAAGLSADITQMGHRIEELEAERDGEKARAKWLEKVVAEAERYEKELDARAKWWHGQVTAAEARVDRVERLNHQLTEDYNTLLIQNDRLVKEHSAAVDAANHWQHEVEKERAAHAANLEWDGATTGRERLEARIEELESELSQWRTSMATEDLTWRAEAAEAEAAKLKGHVHAAEWAMAQHRDWYQVAVRRIAELERALQEIDGTFPMDGDDIEDAEKRADFHWTTVCYYRKIARKALGKEGS